MFSAYCMASGVWPCERQGHLQWGRLHSCGTLGGHCGRRRRLLILPSQSARDTPHSRVDPHMQQDVAPSYPRSWTRSSPMARNPASSRIASSSATSRRPCASAAPSRRAGPCVESSPACRGPRYVTRVVVGKRPPTLWAKSVQSQPQFEVEVVKRLADADRAMAPIWPS